MVDSTTILNQVRGTQRRFSRLWYRFQVLRLTFGVHARALQAECRRLGIAIPQAAVPEFPLYTTTRSDSGVMRLVRRPRVSGGARPILRCWTEASAEELVLHAEGEVDISTAPILSDAITEAYRAASRVIVDLSGLRYLDGSGIRVLEAAARRHPARFVIAGLHREIRRLFEVLGVGEAVPVVASVGAARDYFRLQ
jgi:anti-sigma B factor antagonist